MPRSVPLRSNGLGPIAAPLAPHPPLLQGQPGTARSQPAIRLQPPLQPLHLRQQRTTRPRRLGVGALQQGPHHLRADLADAQARIPAPIPHPAVHPPSAEFARP